MFVTSVPAIILSIAGVNLSDALRVLAGELRLHAGAVVVLTVLALIAAVAAIVVVVAHPGLNNIYVFDFDFAYHYSLLSLTKKLTD
jgi:hypothetical protein